MKLCDLSIKALSLLFPPWLSNTCRCLPGDACWPGLDAWNSLNRSVNGQLIAVTFLAEVCHDPHYDALACDRVKAAWDIPQTHFSRPEGIMAPYFQNQTCDPFTPPEQACSNGNFAEYYLNVTSAEVVVEALKFAQEKNLRVSIKNTGHDYLGKSSGKGSLGLWTHNLKSLSIVDYDSKSYSGKAIKVGAGIQGFEAYEFAAKSKFRVVGGDCPTVGLAGGFTQGGGHSSLSSIYGMGADNVLEWEVVTADGSHLVANKEQNSDLYWALSGGGAGTFAVVISMISKVHPDGTTGGLALSFTQGNVSAENFYQAVEAFHASLPALIDVGATAVYIIYPSVFTIQIMTIPGKTAPQVQSLIKPFLSKLSSLGIKIAALEVSSYPSFYEHYFHYLGPYPYGTISASQSTSGRLIPRSVIEEKNAALTTVVKRIHNIGPEFGFIGFVGSATHAVANNTPSSNAVNPAWRDALISVFIPATWNFTAPLSYNIANQMKMRDVVTPALEKLTPGSATYLNEANFAHPNWQREFYGLNFERLSLIKDKWDARKLFFAKTAVGSEAWTEYANGRLCRT